MRNLCLTHPIITVTFLCNLNFCLHFVFSTLILYLTSQRVPASLQIDLLKISFWKKICLIHNNAIINFI